MDVGDLQLHSDDLFQRGRSMDMKILRASQQAHAGQQTNQPEIMIAMQMGNKDIIDLAAADLVFGHLHLGTLAAVDQKDLIFHRDYLGRRMTIKSRESGIVA